MWTLDPKPRPVLHVPMPRSSEQAFKVAGIFAILGLLLFVAEGM